MKFNEVKCRLLYMGWGNPKHKYRLGGEWIESSPAKKDLGCWWMKITCSPEGQLNPGLRQTQHGQQDKGGDSAPLLRSGERPPGVLPPALEPSALERHGPDGAGPEGHKNDQRAGTPLLGGKAESVGVVQPREE